MQKQGMDALKRMAQMAKNRLRSKVTESEDKMIRSKGHFRVIYGDSIDIRNKIITREDKILYEKVKNIVDEELDVANPIAKLIDYKVYNKMDSLERERYLFDLVDKYKRYKTKYLQEKQLEVV